MAARAEKPGFNITLQKSSDPDAGQAGIYPQNITRALINLINGFPGVSKRKEAASGGAYEPILSASTRNFGHQVEITIRDNGTGIPPEVKDTVDSGRG